VVTFKREAWPLFFEHLWEESWDTWEGVWGATCT